MHLKKLLSNYAVNLKEEFECDLDTEDIMQKHKSLIQVKLGGQTKDCISLMI